jgi:hypothetical protein
MEQATRNNIAMGYGLDCRGLIPGRDKIFLFFIAFKTTVEPVLPLSTEFQAERGQEVTVTADLHLLEI